MDIRQSAKQMIDFQKMAVDSWFNAATLVQAQTASVVDIMLGSAVGMPADGRQAVQNWVQACGQAQDHFRAYVDDSFACIANMFDPQTTKSGTGSSKSNTKGGK